MAGYSKTKTVQQIQRRSAAVGPSNSHAQTHLAEPATNPLATAQPQTVLRALQSGKLSSRQRTEAVSNLAGAYGNQALQRLLITGKTKPILARKTAAPPEIDQEVEPAPAPLLVPAAKPKYENFHDEAVRAKYFAKLTSEHVKSQLSPEFKNPKKKKLSPEALAELQAQHQVSSNAKRKSNEFKMLGLGGWHLGGIHESADGHEKVANKKGEMVTDEVAEANLFDKAGEWHFGTSPEQVIEFFNQVVKVKVPGDLHLHKKAAERLENVYAILQKHGKPWPETSVGQSFRGNLDHAESTASFHAHKLGFALDFRADVNPMLTDGLKRHLLKAVGGGSSNVNLNRGGQEGHRAAIREMGKLVGKAIAENKQNAAAGQVVDVDNVTHLDKVNEFFTLREFDKEYARVKGVSDNFVGSLSQAVITELKELRETYLVMRKTPDFKGKLAKATALKTKIATLEKSKKQDAAAIAESKTALATIQAALDADTVKMRTRIKTLLAPWIKAVSQQRELAKNKYEQEQVTQRKQGEQDAAQQKQLDADYNQKLAAAQQQIAEAKAAGKKSKVKLPTKPKADKTKDKAAKNAAEHLQEKKDELDYWIWLQDTLEVKAYNHLDFVLEKGSTKTIEVDAPLAPGTAPAPVQAEVSTPAASKKGGKSKKASQPATPATPKEKREIETSVMNPSVLQLATRGFFNPDKEKDGKDKGFNKEFVKLMLMHGFAWGATWGSQDTMHFELAEEIDNMPSSLRKYTKRVD